MRMPHEPYLIMRLSDVRAGLLRTVSSRAFLLYVELRQRIWRGTKSRFGTAYYKKGWLAAKGSAKELKNALGLKSRQHVGRLLQELKDVGWVACSKMNVTGDLVYVLGGWFCFNEGTVNEVYWADSRIGDGPHRSIEISVPASIEEAEGGVTFLSQGGWHIYATGGDTKMLQGNGQSDGASLKTYLTSDKPVKNLITKTNKQKKNPSYSLAKNRQSRKNKNPPSPTPSSRIPAAWGGRETPCGDDEDKPQKDTAPVGRKSPSIASKYLGWYQEAFHDNQALTKRSLRHLSDLTKWWGKDDCLAVLRFAVFNWERVAAKLRMSAMVPTIEQIFARRDDIKFLTFAKDPWNSQAVKRKPVTKESSGDDGGWPDWVNPGGKREKVL